MKKIGIFYGTGTVKTAAIAGEIKKAFGNAELETVPVEKAWRQNFEACENLIVGTSTWFDGELPTYWDEILPELETLHLNGKKVAIFGLGDQVGYPDNFADGIGLLAQTFESAGATLIGFTSTEGYHFNRSLAVRDHRFMGLVLDLENQANLTDTRIRQWVEQLKKELEV